MPTQKPFSEREQQWQEAIRCYIQQAQEEHWHVEPDIVETVVVLRECGITTPSASMGVLERPPYAPWVRIYRTDLDEEEKRVWQAWEEAQKQNELKQLPQDEIHRLFSRYHEMRKVLISKHLQERSILLEHLITFYAERQVPFDRILILRDMQYSATLESQGAQFQLQASPQERQRKLIEYQQELRQFTNFLKQIYFSVQ
jgi:hypothetical protein